MVNITSLLGVKELGTILGVWAHPDDESFMAAGLMAAAAQNGQEVICVTATKGEAGSQDKAKWPPETLGEVRIRELASALSILGVRDNHLLGYSDGSCDKVPHQEAVNQLLDFMGTYQPDTIITFPPNGLTGHPDHIAVSRWAKAAVEQFTQKPVKLYYALNTQEQYNAYLKQIDDEFNIYSNIDAPHLLEASACDIDLILTAELCHLKQMALAAMPSQYKQVFEKFGRNFMEAAFSREAFVKAEKYVS